MEPHPYGLLAETERLESPAVVCLPKQSWVVISQIRTLAVERIGRKIGAASPEELAQVIDGLNEIVGE
jgi:mRNA interferase MazF